MPGLNAQLQPLTFPEGTEFPGNIQALQNLQAQYYIITGLDDFIGVAYGDVEPAPEFRDLWWARTDGGGNALGWYYWSGAAWSPLPIAIPSGATGTRPSSPPNGSLFFDTTIKVVLIYYDGSWHTEAGSPGDIKYVAGTLLADVLTKNPGWSHYTDGIGRNLSGALADGSDAEDDLGSEDVTLTEAELPAHKHIDLVVTGSDADNGDPGNLTVMAPGNSIGLKTVTNSETGMTGDGEAFSVLNPTKRLFCLRKD